MAIADKESNEFNVDEVEFPFGDHFIARYNGFVYRLERDRIPNITTENKISNRYIGESGASPKQFVIEVETKRVLTGIADW